MDFWAAIIVGGLSLAGTLFGSYFANSKNAAVMAYRMQALEDKVNKHNQVVERMAVAENSLKSAWAVIGELKGRMDK